MTTEKLNITARISVTDKIAIEYSKYYEYNSSYQYGPTAKVIFMDETGATTCSYNLNMEEVGSFIDGLDAVLRMNDHLPQEN